MSKLQLSGWSIFQAGLLNAERDCYCLAHESGVSLNH